MSFVVLGMEHSIANMFMVPASMMLLVTALASDALIRFYRRSPKTTAFALFCSPVLPLIDQGGGQHYGGRDPDELSSYRDFRGDEYLINLGNLTLEDKLRSTPGLLQTPNPNYQQDTPSNTSFADSWQARGGPVSALW